MSNVVPFVRPLQWAVDLDVRGYEAQLMAEVVARMPPRRKIYTYRHLGLRLQIYQALSNSDVCRDLEPLVARCRPLWSQRFTVVGAALAARPLDDETRAALRKLTHDPRILERLGLDAEQRAAQP